MEGLLNLLTAISVVLIVLVLVSVRRMHVRVEYSMSWLSAAFALLVLSRCHVALNYIAAALRIDSPALALLTLTGCLFLLVVFRLSVVVSALKDSNIALAQRVAILEYQIRSHEEQQA